MHNLFIWDVKKKYNNNNNIAKCLQHHTSSQLTVSSISWYIHTHTHELLYATQYRYNIEAHYACRLISCSCVYICQYQRKARINQPSGKRGKESERVLGEKNTYIYDNDKNCKFNVLLILNTCVCSHSHIKKHI